MGVAFTNSTSDDPALLPCSRTNFKEYFGAFAIGYLTYGR